MDVVVLGAAGVMGSAVVERLVRAEDVTTVVAADRDAERARSVLPDADTVDIQGIDVTDHEALVALLEDQTVAVNCVGPFYEFAPPVVEAALDADVDLVDICDDYDVTETLLDEYDAAAEAAGVTVVLGCGASPGMTNVLARQGADQLDVVDRIDVRVTRGAGAAAGAAIPYHVFHSWLGSVPVYENGAWTTANALQDGREVTAFPEPFGQVDTYYFGHPETVTLPRVLDVDTVTTKGTLLPGIVRETLLDIQSLGLLDEDPLDVNGTKVRPLDFAAAHLDRLGEMVASASSEVPSGGAIVVEVTGRLDGRETTHRYMGTAPMRDATAAAAATGARLVGTGAVASPGVRPPEDCIPPDPFIQRLLDEPGFDFWTGTTQKQDPERESQE